MLSRLRRALTGCRHFVVRRLALPVLGTRPARRAALALSRSRYRTGDRLGDLVDRVLIASTPDVEERAASTRALVELFFDLCDGVDVFVEAGAKEGSASVRAVALGIDTVVAFEANPYTHRRFGQALGQSGVDYRHAALSSRSGQATFLVRKSEDGTPMADGQGSLLVRPDHEPGYEEVTVPTVTLDAEVVDGRVAMWVDVEGAVAEVFGGATQILERTDVLIVEVEAVERWVGQRWLADEVVDQLMRSGLRAVGRDMQSRWQFNILFVRDRLLSEPRVIERISTWRRASPVDETTTEGPQ
jgi:FkbM family methyltransferase